ncbi:MAG: O-antigen ligase family protein [Terriglobales bacterium]
MTSTTLTYPLRAAWRRSGGVLRGILGVCSLAIFTIVVMALVGVSTDSLGLFLWCSIFLTALWLARPLSGSALAGERESFLLANLVIWMFLMISEAIFVHNQSTASAAQGGAEAGAIYQAYSWILSFFVLAFISCFRPAYLRRLFAGPLKWASIFVIVAVLSCPLSKKPLYSAALAFKLCLIVLVLCAIGEAIKDEAGIFKLFAALFLGTFITVSADLIAPFLGSGPIFDPQTGRFGAMVGLSGICGILLLLSVLFLWLKKNLWFLLCGLYSVLVMMLAGTKGGIVASFVSLMMFFVLLKRPAQALAASLGFAVIFALCIAFTPLGQSLEKYTEAGHAGTITGRTNLWAAAWPEIKAHPMLGNGYRASRFLSEDVPGAFKEAGNMHNSFLEVLYNNGLAGLVPIVAINVLIVVNLTGILIRPPTVQLRYYAAAAFALYTHLFVWGLVAATFGGAPDNRFMTLFAVLLISMFLRGQSDKKYWNTIYGAPSSR